MFDPSLTYDDQVGGTGGGAELVLGDDGVAPGVLGVRLLDDERAEVVLVVELHEIRAVLDHAHFMKPANQRLGIARDDAFKHGWRAVGHALWRDWLLHNRCFALTLELFVSCCQGQTHNTGVVSKCKHGTAMEASMQINYTGKTFTYKSKSTKPNISCINFTKNNPTQ